ncbi:RagB/SusD family nutrient uptake outer membrane protein [Puteibacter caeruleilacunae]|nr:RagB/SusD family nutrient uptake outer membrane protein [Puteibacter caeruleilacunae]
MKTIYSLSLLVIGTLLFTGCDHLDFDESVGEPKEYFYAYMSTTNQLVNYHYSMLYQDFGVVDEAMLDCATDDAEYVYSDSKIQSFNDGSWSAMKTRDDRWSISYNAIRSINDFLKTFAETDFSKFKYNDTFDESFKKLESLPYEARLLRAIYLFDLAKRYGDIPMPLTVLTPDEANAIVPTSFDDVIDFIVDECDATAAELPWVYTAELGETGRVTKGVAMALKSRALLFAASKLHNSAGESSKWTLAAQAAKELIDEQQYELESNVAKNITNLVTSKSKELIMVRRNSDSNKFEKLNFPIGYEGGNTGVCPTQNLVDAFQTKNGYDVTLTSSGWVSNDSDFEENEPFANRDPRMSKALLYNGQSFKGRAIEAYEGGLDGLPIQGASLTGYYLRKYLIEDLNLSPGINEKGKHHWIVFRYAEILLNYAEAMNEAYGPDYTDATFTMSAVDALNLVRGRAEMPLVTAGLTKEQFTTVLRRERRVEFAFEGMRFWDVRRWMIGNETQKAIYGAAITMNEDGETSYALKLIEERNWNEKMNLFPIPQQELYINPNLEQNTGW